MSERGAAAERSAFNAIKRLVKRVSGGVVLVSALVLVLIAGAAFVVVPAVFGILVVEWGRMRRWWSHPRPFHPTAGREPGVYPALAGRGGKPHRRGGA